MPWFTDDSCAASQPPTEATTTLRQRHTPHLGLLTLEVVPQAALVGLVDRLSADPQGVPYLGPGSPVTACRHGQQIACIGQRLLGVSHLPKSLQRPLWPPQRECQALDHATDPPARVGALIGAHVNGYWQPPQTPGRSIRSILIARSDAANCSKQAISQKANDGAPSSDISPPGDYVRPLGPICGPIQPKKETPQERQLLGVVDDIRGN